jgi:hypothetical protein
MFGKASGRAGKRLELRLFIDAKEHSGGGEVNRHASSVCQARPPSYRVSRRVWSKQASVTATPAKRPRLVRHHLIGGRGSFASPGSMTKV